jgi:magnesium chelatase accessory protein
MSVYRDQRLKARLAAIDWPNRAFSRTVDAGGVTFHVQQFGEKTAPQLLMLHGTGASTHSFARLCAALGDEYRFTLVDLPGHGFSQAPADFLPRLPDMARALSALLATLGVEGATVIGHSAGGAIALHMAIDAPRLFARIITLNAALEPMKGHSFLSPLAKGLFLNPLTPQLFAWRARFGGMTRIMLRATGSTLDDTAMAQYQFLLEDADHVRGALAMMANWDLQPLQDALPHTACPVVLIAAEDDMFVPSRVSKEAAAHLPDAVFLPVALGGHLVHETDPALIAAMIAERASTPVTQPLAPGFA